MADELLTPGKGKFLIKRVKTHDNDGVVLETSKGDRKVMIVVDVTDAKGKKGTVFEHLTMNAAWKVELICKACNLGELFISDALCLDNLEGLEGAVGECIVGISEANGKWPEQTVVSKYIVPKATKAKTENVVNEFFGNDLEDQIPF